MLNLVVALAAEAAPLVERYGLRPVLEPSPFPLFAGDGLRLVVSGMGRVAAASAVCWLAGRDKGAAGQGWLNLGIGGSSAWPAGTLVIAEEVVEVTGGRRWRMPVPEVLLPAARVVTVDRPWSEFGEGELYEMEASGFVAAARRFGRKNEVHCIKVVSDGPHTPWSALDGRAVNELVAAALGGIGEIVRSRLGAGNPGWYGEAPAVPPGGFSVEQACRLQRLWWRARREGVASERVILPESADVEPLLRALERILQPTAR